MAVLIKFAIAIPHTSWIPARVESLEHLLHGLCVNTRIWNEDRAIVSRTGPPGAVLDCVDAHVFDEREPNWSWSRKIFEWGATTSATHLVQLQDDVIPAPNFWPALRAMVTALPRKIIGLQGAHPKFRTLAREGHRWATSAAWMVGVGWVIPVESLAELVDFRDEHDDDAKVTNEDEFIGKFCNATGRYVWHPIPTLIDHDVSIESTYKNDNHLFRTPTVTWREFGENEIERPDFWTVRGAVPMVSNPHFNRCWFCENEPQAVTFGPTQALIGRACLAKATAHLLLGAG